MNARVEGVMKAEPVEFELNGRKVTGYAGETIIQAAKRHGVEFFVMVCGDIMTMPGLPKLPSAEKIDLDDNGKVFGMF